MTDADTNSFSLPGHVEAHPHPESTESSPHEPSDMIQPAHHRVKRGGAPNWTPEQAREASRKAAAVRARKAAERRQREEAAARSSREVMADVLLSEHQAIEEATKRLLSIAAHAAKDSDAVSAARALTALLDQAFGRMPAADKPVDAGDEQTPWEAMTPTQRAQARKEVEALLAERMALREAADGVDGAVDEADPAD